MAGREAHSRRCRNPVRWKKHDLVMGTRKNIAMEPRKRQLDKHFCDHFGACAQAAQKKHARDGVRALHAEISGSWDQECKNTKIATCENIRGQGSEDQTN